MASTPDLVKVVFSYCNGSLKEKDMKMKRVLFFNSCVRKKLKNDLRTIDINEGN